MGDPESGGLTGLQGVQDRASLGGQSLLVFSQPAFSPGLSLVLWLFLHLLGAAQVFLSWAPKPLTNYRGPIHLSKPLLSCCPGVPGLCMGVGCVVSTRMVYDRTHSVEPGRELMLKLIMNSLRKRPELRERLSHA